MGDRDGRVRLDRRHVSLLRRPPGDRSTVAGRCLHFRLPPASGSIAGRPDEITGENLPRALVQKPETRIGRKTRGSTRMKMLSSRAKSRDSVAVLVGFATGFFDSASLRLK